MTFQGILPKVGVTAVPDAEWILQRPTVCSHTLLSIIHVAAFTAASEGTIAGVEGVLVFLQMYAHSVRTTVPTTTVGGALKVANGFAVAGQASLCTALAHALDPVLEIVAQTGRPTLIQQLFAVVHGLTPGLGRPLGMSGASHVDLRVAINLITSTAGQNIKTTRMYGTSPFSMLIFEHFTKLCLRASFMLSRGVVGCRLCQVPDLRDARA